MNCIELYDKGFIIATVFQLYEDTLVYREEEETIRDRRGLYGGSNCTKRN